MVSRVKQESPNKQERREDEEAQEEQKAGYLEYWGKHLREEYVNVMAEVEESPQGNRAKYVNWNHYFRMLFPDTSDGKAALTAYHTKMMNLYKDCKAVCATSQSLDALSEY